MSQTAPSSVPRLILCAWAGPASSSSNAAMPQPLARVLRRDPTSDLGGANRSLPPRYRYASVEPMLRSPLQSSLDGRLCILPETGLFRSVDVLDQFDCSYGVLEILLALAIARMLHKVLE